MGAATTAGLSLASGIMQGSGTQAADDYQANKQRVAAEYARGAAAETDSQMRENLNVSLENIDAIRSAAGIDPTSPTTAALKQRAGMIADRQRSIQVGNIMAQAAQDESDANYLQQAGSFAYTQGIIGGIAGAAGKLAQTKFSYGGGGGGGGGTAP